jgi:hypothetical protein
MEGDLSLVDRCRIDFEDGSTVLVTGEETLAGLTAEARDATVRQVLRYMRLADAILNPAEVRREAAALDHLQTVADGAAAMVLAEVARVYAARFEVEVDAQTLDAAALAAYELPEQTGAQVQPIAALAATLRAGLAEDPAANEKIHRYLLQNLTAWALRDIARDRGAAWLQTASDADLQPLLRQHFDASIAGGLTDLLIIYAGEFGQDVLEAIDLQQRPLLALRQILVDGLLPSVSRPPRRARATNRKVALPFPAGTIFRTPNIQNHGNRHLARIIAGDAAWEADPSGGHRQIAILDGQAIGRIDFSTGQEAAERVLLRVLSPRAIKTMVATSRLILDGTSRSPLNHGVTIRVAEIARAMGYKPDKHRAIDPEIMRRCARDVYMLSKIETWAADGPYNPKAPRRQSGWIAPLIAITAVHVSQVAMDEPPLPYEFDAMLGRNWGQALLDSDFLQIAPGLMEIHDDSAIRLAWFYLTEFRYRMRKRTAGATRKITALCVESGIDPGQAKDRGRFLQRLEGWHAQLKEQEVLGDYDRTPPLGDNMPPSRIFAEGEYHAEPPVAILQAYAESRRHALQAPKRRGTAAKVPG